MLAFLVRDFLRLAVPKEVPSFNPTLAQRNQQMRAVVPHVHGNPSANHLLLRRNHRLCATKKAQKNNQKRRTSQKREQSAAKSTFTHAHTQTNTTSQTFRHCFRVAFVFGGSSFKRNRLAQGD
uniref:Uncharacterized protein n=1 Tax=Erythrolobus madagascarensis TaxID=708628 RepID=A0A7S0T8I2_9RHOD